MRINFQNSIIFLLINLLVSINFQILAQTRIDGTFLCGTSFESSKYIFKKDGSFITKVFTDYGEAYYGRGLYEINNEYLILSFDKIPEDEFDTLFVHKEIKVDSNNINNPIHYKFFIQKYYPSILFEAVACLYDSNEKIVKPFNDNEDTCVYSDSLGCWDVSINSNNLPAKIRIFYRHYKLLTFSIRDHFSREIKINLKEDWYYFYPYTSHYKVYKEKFEIRNLDTLSFELLKGQNWLHFIKKD